MLSPDIRITAANDTLIIRKMKASDQLLLDLIPYPCFLFVAHSEGIIISQKLVDFLRFDSIQDVHECVKLGYQFIDGINTSNLKEQLIELSKKNRQLPLCHTFIRKDGSRFTGEISVNELPLENSGSDTRLNAYFGIIHDIEQDKKKSIKGSDYGDIVIIHDFSGKILQASKNIRNVNFIADPSIRNHNLFQLIDPHYLNNFRQRLRNIGSDPLRIELRLMDEAEKSLFVELICQRVVHKGRSCIQTQIRDLSIQKDLEKKLLETIIQTEEKEKQRFAADLHDELGPFLAGIKLYIDEIDRNLENFERRRTLMDFLKKMVDDAIAKTRLISNSLISNLIMDFGLEKAIESFVSQINQVHKSPIYTSIGELPGTISKTLEINVYRILIEFINNSLKHANAQSIAISICTDDSYLNVIYEDNGKGFDFEKEILTPTGIGLTSIMNRIKSTHAVYSFKSSPNQGMHVEIKFPIT
jgi:signal transduction histidine kinase